NLPHRTRRRTSCHFERSEKSPHAGCTGASRNKNAMGKVNAFVAKTANKTKANVKNDNASNVRTRFISLPPCAYSVAACLEKNEGRIKSKSCIDKTLRIA